MNNKTIIFSITNLQGKRINNKTEVVFQIIKHTRITQRLLIKKKKKDFQKLIKHTLKHIKKI
jgi:hypothetical protein